MVLRLSCTPGCRERFGYLPGRPDPAPRPERGFRCIEEEVQSDNPTVGYECGGFNHIDTGGSDNLPPERWGGVLERTSSYPSLNAVLSSDSPTSFLPLGKNHLPSPFSTTTIFPVDGWMATIPAPSMNSVMWKKLSGIAGVDLSESW